MDSDLVFSSNAKLKYRNDTKKFKQEPVKNGKLKNIEKMGEHYLSRSQLARLPFKFMYSNT